MGKTLNVIMVLALAFAAIGAVTMATMTSVSAASNDTYPYSATMMSGGNQVFYVIMMADGSIHPATDAEKNAIDVAMADGTLKQHGLNDYIGRGVQ